MTAIVLSSDLSGVSPMSEALSGVFLKHELPHLVIHVHNLHSSKLQLVESDAGLHLWCGEHRVNVSCVLMMQHWRTDAIVNVPCSLDTPNVYRFQAEQFVRDIAFAFPEVPWIPGPIWNILASDSKPHLFRLARRCGHFVPNKTVNASNPPAGDAFFRKTLGPPFVLSYSEKMKEEVGVTVTGVREEHDNACDPGLYQWQKIVDSQTQLRTYFVRDRVWAASIARKSLDEDLRSRSESGEVLDWQTHTLPEALVRKTMALMRELGIVVAAPEFLLSEKGEYVLIDVNPCGD